MSTQKKTIRAYGKNLILYTHTYVCNGVCVCMKIIKIIANKLRKFYG